MKKLQYRSLIAVAIALALGGSLVTACSPKTDAADKTAARPALTVQTVVAENGEVPLLLVASGNIAAWQDISISTQTQGLRLADLKGNVGDEVKKGQVLATFATDTIDAEVLQAQANLLSAQAQAQDAQSNAERARSIEGTGALSQQQINQLNTAAKATAAQVQAARAILQLQKTRQGFARITAPDDGVISSRTATVGAVPQAGTEMFRMVRQGRIEWRAEISGQDIARVHVGDAVTVRTSSGESVTGTVRSISPTLDAAKRVGIVYVDLPDAHDAGVRAGMYASGEITVGTAQGLMVPQSTVMARDGFNYVFVLQADNKVKQQLVETGVVFGGKVQIVKGIAAGAKLVLNGASFLSDGDLVRVVAPAPAASAASAAENAASANAAASAASSGSATETSAPAAAPVAAPEPSEAASEASNTASTAAEQPASAATPSSAASASAATTSAQRTSGVQRASSGKAGVRKTGLSAPSAPSAKAASSRTGKQS